MGKKQKEKVKSTLMLIQSQALFADRLHRVTPTVDAQFVCLTLTKYRMYVIFSLGAPWIAITPHPFPFGLPRLLCHLLLFTTTSLTFPFLWGYSSDLFLSFPFHFFFFLSITLLLSPFPFFPNHSLSFSIFPLILATFLFFPTPTLFFVFLSKPYLSLLFLFSPFILPPFPFFPTLSLSFYFLSNCYVFRDTW